ncbi:MAG: hypothetical protein IPJ13_24825 [Saprospiraceae bacterium]|nr:hypothetical protein [Saprospiraceae bacterium]
MIPMGKQPHLGRGWKTRQEKKVTKAKGMDRLQFTNEVELKVETERCERGADLMAVKVKFQKYDKCKTYLSHR